MFKLKLVVFVIVFFSYSHVWADIYEASIDVEEKTDNDKNWDTFVLESSRPPDIQLFIDDINLGSCKDSFKCKIEFNSNKEDIFVKLIDDDTGLSYEDDLISQGECSLLQTCLLKKATISFKNISNEKKTNYGNCKVSHANLFSKKISIALTKSVEGGSVVEETILRCTYIPDKKYYNIISSVFFLCHENQYLCHVESELLMSEDSSDVSYRTTYMNNAFQQLIKEKKAQDFTKHLILFLIHGSYSNN